VDAIGLAAGRVANKLDEWFDAGLRDWDVSRDAPYFGIEIPDAPGKYFYVWLDAPVGYMASFENYCKRSGLDFEEWWKPGSPAELHHFIGKDILYFHSLFWPATLEGAGLRKPTAVHAHGFPDGERREDVEVARHLRDGATLPRPPAARLFPLFLAAKLGPGLEDIDMNLEEFATRINAEARRQAGQHREPLRELHPPRLRRPPGRGAAGPALYREFVDAGPASWKPGRRSSTRPQCARSWPSPTARTSTSTATSPGSRRKTRRAPPRSRRLHAGHQPVPRADGLT
jgi:methionyl-tRNA synthetase